MESSTGGWGWGWFGGPKLVAGVIGKKVIDLKNAWGKTRKLPKAQIAFEKKKKGGGNSGEWPNRLKGVQGRMSGGGSGGENGATGEKPRLGPS